MEHAGKRRKIGQDTLWEDVLTKQLGVSVARSAAGAHWAWASPTSTSSATTRTHQTTPKLIFFLLLTLSVRREAGRSATALASLGQQVDS